MATSSFENEIIVVDNVVICAVPFLRDSDIRKSIDAETHSSRIENVRNGIKEHYNKLADIIAQKYPNHIKIAMGHLFVQGVTTSDSEREIQIGNLASFQSEMFPKLFDYIALGHIHKPQIINNQSNIRYSGSPIPLSFSERYDKKIIVEIEVINHKLNIKEIEIPKFRNLVSLEGNFLNIKNEIENYQNYLNFATFFEVKVIEKNYNPLILNDFKNYFYNFEDKKKIILKESITFENQINFSDEFFTEGQTIEEINEKDIFLKRIDLESTLSIEQKKMLLETFEELISIVNNSF